MSFGKINRQWGLTALCLAAFAATGCSPNTSVDGNGATAGTTVVAANSPTSQTATAEQWQTAVKGVFDKVNLKKLRDKRTPEYILDDGKTDADGVAEFFGCFDKAPPKCDVIVSGRRDGFRKIQFLYDPLWKWDESGAQYFKGSGKSSVDGYISLIDCGQPKMLLQPTYRSGSWIFMERFSLMVDGTVVIDRKFDIGQVERNNSHNSVSETAHFILNENELKSLRKVDQSKQILIRLTGQKGYSSIDPDGSKAFAQGIPKLLRMYDDLDHATTRLGAVKDAACPA